jgi:hypothetical protein
MSPPEVRILSELYARLAAISDESEAERRAAIRAKSLMPEGPASFNSEQNIHAYALVSDIATSPSI